MRFTAERLVDGPIISPHTRGYDADALGLNINGPSLIRVPGWVEKPLGRYYLYFAHHQGTSIRLAYADALAGPWTVHAPGSLRMEQTPFVGHIASPDVHVDEANRRLVMYYHGCGPKGMALPPGEPQVTCVAFSEDGLSWRSHERALGASYFRVFEHAGWSYAVAHAGKVYRSRDGVGDFEKRGGPQLDASGRHWAVMLRGDTAHLFYSRWGDMPEHLLHAWMPLEGDWGTWRLAGREPLLTSEHAWEGADQPVRVSVMGSVHEPVHELRDPCVFEEGDKTYLLYSVAGESGIAIAELHEA